MAYAQSLRQSNTAWAVRHGVTGGAVAGVLFALAAMVGSLLTGGEALMPRRAFASVLLGIELPQMPLSTAVLVGTVFHMGLSIVLGVNFSALRRSAGVLVLAATVYGSVIWLLNFFVIAPAIGRPWFTEAPMLLQVIYQAFFFGAMLGVYLSWRDREPGQVWREKRGVGESRAHRRS